MYSVNHGNFFVFEQGVKEYITACQKKDATTGGPYTQRYIGSMVSDVHRNLIRGGIFLYPTTTNKPKGKLRLLYECNPFAYIVEKAGGKATNGIINILDVVPTELHERSALYIGSVKMMEELEGYMNSIKK
jgi:fructose-1,6-bisphosphatase I